VTCVETAIYLSIRLHGATSQKADIFIINNVVLVHNPLKHELHLNNI
jgi:hypothetical protein